MTMIKGTSKMLRYPKYPWAKNDFGIKHFGTVQTAQGLAYKVSQQNITQLERIGWRYVGKGTSYAYMLKPKVKRP